MKKLVKYIFLTGFFLAFANGANAQDTIIRYKKTLVPNYINFQYAGNYGAYIIGAGYFMNKKQNIELVAGYGYTSKHKAAARIHNVFLKGIVIPKTWNLKNNWSLSAQTGIAISRQFSGNTNTFTRLPKTYPDGYYAPNAFRFHFNFGGKVRKYLGDDHFIKAIDFYIETTTNDLYLTYLFKSSEVGLRNIFSMAFGFNFIIFDKN